MRRILSIIFAAWVLTAWVSCTGDGAAMRQRLAYVSQCNRDDTLFTEAWLPTVDSLVSYFDRHGNANERMTAHYLQGRVHHDMGEAPIALECYQKATEVADTSSKDSSTLHTLAAIYGQMADLFHSQYLPDDEMKAIRMAEYLDWKNKDTIAAITAYRLRAGAYSLRNDTDSMLFVTRKSIEMYKKHGRNDIAAQVLIFPISVSLDRGDLRNAWKDMQTLENESGFFDQDLNVLRGKEIYYYYKGIYLLSQNQSDSAIVLFGKAVSAGFLEAGYKGLLSAYEKKRNPDSLAKYARLYADANDKSYMGVEQEIIHKTSALYDFNHQQKIAEINARKASQNNLAAIFIAILGIISIIVVYKRAKNQFMRKLAKLSQDYESAFCNLSIAKDKLRLLNYDYETNNHRLEAEINKLRQSIDKAHNEKKELGKDMDVIQCKLNDLLDENNELRKQHKVERKKREREIARLQEQVKSLEERLRMEDVLATESRFKSTVIYKKFMVRGQSRHVLFPPTEKDWEGLTEAIRLHFVRYYSLITHQHSLPTNQYRLCLLIRLGVSNEQLRILLDKDTQQIYRLKKLANQALFNCQDASTLEDNLRRYFE